MSLDYKPFQQSRPPTKLKEATFAPMNFCFIDEFVQSKENMADSAMKNLPEKLFRQHVVALKTGVNLSQREDVGDNGEIVPMMSSLESA